MSLESWKAEFYPIPARGVLKSELVAAQHSLLKWRGALPENLAKHGLQLNKCNGHNIEEIGGSGEFDFNAGTCALCEIHRNDNGRVVCDSCILNEITEGGACSSQYLNMYVERTPAPMIGLLTLAVERLDPSTPAEGQTLQPTETIACDICLNSVSGPSPLDANLRGRFITLHSPSQNPNSADQNERHICTICAQAVSAAMERRQSGVSICLTPEQWENCYDISHEPLPGEI